MVRGSARRRLASTVGFYALAALFMLPTVFVFYWMLTLSLAMLSFSLYVMGLVTGVVTLPLVVAGPRLVDRVIPDRLDFLPVGQDPDR